MCYIGHTPKTSGALHHLFYLFDYANQDYTDQVVVESESEH
jgi:hypothetical protein